MRPGVEEWQAHEAERLRSTDAFLEEVTEADLGPILSQETTDPNDTARFLDIGAGTGSTTEKLCDQSGVSYYPFDANRDYLQKRENEAEERGDEFRGVQGRSEALPFQDGAFNITYSRAVTAWSSNPEGALEEQLRVTREGGTAVFTEFDWTHCAADPSSDALEACMTARAVIMLALTTAGFRPEYGAQLGSDIDRVAQANGLEYERVESRHELPEGDYRELFLGVADNVLLQLRKAGPGVGAMLANMLEGCVERIKFADNCSIRLPALVTQTVRVKSAQEQRVTQPIATAA